MTTKANQQSNRNNETDRPVYHSHYLNGNTYVYIRTAEEVNLEGKDPFYSFKGAIKTGKADDKQSLMVEGYLSETAWKYVKPFQSQLESGDISLGVEVNGLRLNGATAFIATDDTPVPVLRTDIFKIKSILPFERNLKVVSDKSASSAESSADIDNAPF